MKSDNSDSATITVTAVSSANAAVSGVPVTFSVDSGFLSTASATTDATGKATATFSSGADPTTRTATIVARASGLTSQVPVRVTGSTLTATTSSTALNVGAAPATLTINAKNAAGTAIAGQRITIAQAGTGSVALGATTGTTDSAGNFVTTATGQTAGAVQLTLSGVGEVRTLNLSVTGASSAFQITTPTSSATTAASVGVPVPFSVLAPSPTTRVTFATTLGTWTVTTGTVISGAGTSVLTVTPLANGTASAQLNTTSAGVANVQVFDPDRQASASDSRSVSVTAACSAASKVTLQSTPSVVAPNSGGTTNLASLIATVTDASSNPVGSCPVAFSILNSTGGGETVSPAVVLTAATAGNGTGLGQATATFAAGSLPSGAGGVQIRATVVQPGSSTTVATGTSPSGQDATVVIGGTAGSITIGQATTLQDTNNNTTYVLPMSVLVADSNGNPVANTTVSLSTWPIAFNAGGNVCSSMAPGVFYFNEDRNENLIRDPSETGARLFYPSGTTSSSVPSGSALTPPNSAAGTLPATVTTGSNGVATFNLTYLKSNAGYIVDRIRARTIVQGTETVGEVRFTLGYLVTDIGPPCLLSPSPFN